MQSLMDPSKNLIEALAVVDLRDLGQRRSLAREVAESGVHQQVDGIAQTLVARAGRFKDFVGGAIESDCNFISAVRVGHASSWHAKGGER